MGILDEEDDSSKRSPSIIISEAKDKDSRAEQNYRHVNLKYSAAAAARVLLPSSPHPPPQKYPPEVTRCSPPPRLPCPPRQYSFNASNFVWSTGLYSTLHEDLNLNGWKFFENCKRIWETADNRMKKHHGQKRSKGQRVVVSGLGKMKQKPRRHSGSGKNTKPSKKKDRATSPASFSLVRSPSPAPQLPLAYQCEDLSMSLEPISSSSFHSSSDCDEDDRDTGFS